MDIEIEKARDRWDLNQERVFMENLLQQRFNFFVISFSLVMAAGTAANSLSELNFVLLVGFFLSLLLGFTVYRAFVKVDTVLYLLHQIKDHSMHKSAEKAVKKWPLSFRVNDLLGYGVPLFCLFIIIVWGILANLGVIEVR